MDLYSVKFCGKRKREGCPSYIFEWTEICDVMVFVLKHFCVSECVCLLKKPVGNRYRGYKANRVGSRKEDKISRASCPWQMWRGYKGMLYIFWILCLRLNGWSFCILWLWISVLQQVYFVTAWKKKLSNIFSFWSFDWK